MTRLVSKGRYPNAQRWLLERMADDVGQIETMLHYPPARRLGDYIKAAEAAHASLRRLAEYSKAMALYLNPSDVEEIFLGELLGSGHFVQEEGNDDGEDDGD